MSQKNIRLYKETSKLRMDIVNQRFKLLVVSKLQIDLGTSIDFTTSNYCLYIYN